MTTLTPFTFPETGQPIRAIGDLDAPLFHHGDVCRALEHTNPSVAARMLDDDESVMIDVREIAAGQTALNSSYPAPTTGNSEARFVTEAGLYSLILRSNLPQAKAFKRWLTHEVIPAIRRTGRFEVEPWPMDELEMAERNVVLIREKRAALARVAELEPIAHSWTTLASGDGDFSVADAAKILSRDPAIDTGRNRLFGILHEMDWAYVQNADHRYRAKQYAIERRWLSELPQSYSHPVTGELTLGAPQLRITVKGLHELHKRLGGTAPVQVPSVPVQGGAA